jgi:hypothetical protein
VNIFSPPREQRVIARCQGHSSFLSALTFDDLQRDGRTYHFGNVGEDDNKLILVGSSSSSQFPALTYRDAVGLLGWDTAPSKATLKSPIPVHYIASPARGAPTRRPPTSRSTISSLPPAQWARSRVTVVHCRATRSRSCSRCWPSS